MTFLIKYVLLIYFVINISQCFVDIVFDQSLLNNGFHRLLRSNITLYGNITSCTLLVEEKLPKNFFVIKDELEDTTYEIFATLNQKLDLETISSASNPFSLYVYLNRSQPVTTSLENHSEYFYILPIHLRYHDPKIGGGYREIKKSMAMLFSRCPDGIVTSSSAVVKFPCKPYSTDICEWSSLPFTQLVTFSVDSSWEYKLL
ncbi:hypothetical protein PGB90_000208 [Kerria lacca]